MYRVSGKEVTLHTISGNLYVYRSLIALDRRIGDFVVVIAAPSSSWIWFGSQGIGDSVQHKPVKMLLIEEGLLAPEEEPGNWEIVFQHRGWYGTGWPLLTRLPKSVRDLKGTAATSAPPVDTSSVRNLSGVSLRRCEVIFMFGTLFFLEGPVFRIYHERYRCRSEWTWFRDTQLSQVARIAQISQQTSAMGAKTATTLGHQGTFTQERWLLRLKRLHEPFIIKDLKWTIILVTNQYNQL